MLFSVTHDTFLGSQRPEPSSADRLHSTTVGPKERTGFMQNSKHVWTADCPARFITDYQMRSEFVSFFSSKLCYQCCKPASRTVSLCLQSCSLNKNYFSKLDITCKWNDWRLPAGSRTRRRRALTARVTCGEEWWRHVMMGLHGAQPCTVTDHKSTQHPRWDDLSLMSPGWCLRIPYVL